MKVILKTNVDAYKRNCFPTNLEMPPRIGESVMVVEGFVNHFYNQKLPTRMEVVDVTWTESGVICDLWYKKVDVEAAKLSGINLFP